MTLSYANLHQIAFSILGALFASSLFITAAVGPVPVIGSRFAEAAQDKPCLAEATRERLLPKAGAGRDGSPPQPPSSGQVK